LDAGKQVRKATEGGKEPAHYGQRKMPEAKESIANAEMPRRPQKKCGF
jgi:hypothetical protein